MASVFDAAQFLLSNMGQMDTWKLHKLCYYSQAWTLAWSGGKELFPEEFEAWSNGPVCPPLFREHKGMFVISASQFLRGDKANLKEDEAENISIIIEDYGSKDSYWLREQTHFEDPWRLARGDTPEGKPSNAIITKESMGLYYGGL